MGGVFSPDVGTLDCTTKIIFSKFNVISKVRHMKDINFKVYLYFMKKMGHQNTNLNPSKNLIQI